MAVQVDYKCVTTVDAIRDYIGNHKLVAFDIETAPLDDYRSEERSALDPAKSEMVGVSFSISKGTGIYVPLKHRVGVNLQGFEFYDFWKAFLTSKTITKVAHNLLFESSHIYKDSIVIQPPVYDTMVASQMTLNSNTSFRRLYDSGLKKLAEDLCDEPLPSFASVTKDKHFDELNPQDEETIRYGAADSDFSLRLYHIFNDWFDRFLPKHRWIVENMESPVAVYLGIMKNIGVPVDLKTMEERKREAHDRRERIRGDIAFIIGDINIGENASTVAFKNYLFRELKLPVLKRTLKDREALDDTALILLKEWCQENRPELFNLFTLVQEYRKWGKITSTYVDGYLKYVNSATGRIHPEIFALSTDTGRMSCRRPNAQNMPRKSNDPIGIRGFIKAPEGHVILSLDFSQIELRVGAFYCRDEVMMETYRNGGDIHDATTEVIFGIDVGEIDKQSDVYKEQRTIAKGCNFGVFFGLFPKGLQSNLRFKAGVQKTIEECDEIINNLKAGYQALTRWQADVIQKATSKRYTETWLGRRRYLPDITHDEWGKKSFAQRCALNTPIQGTAADILKLAIVRILLGLDARPWLMPILQIHDELTFIVPTDKVEEAVGHIRECMEQQPFEEFDLPLVAEASAGENFADMLELEGIDDSR